MAVVSDGIKIVDNTYFLFAYESWKNDSMG